MPPMEIERKYLVNPAGFPASLWKALRSGTFDPDIIRRGRLTQLYLPITRDTVRQAVHAILLAQAPTERLSATDRCFFSDPTNISELRILQREESYIADPDPADALEKQRNHVGDSASVAVPDSFQITLKGHARENGSVRPNIETTLSTDRTLSWDVADLIEHAEEHANWSEEEMKVEKMWYDIAFEDVNGESHIAELDIFPDLNYMAVGEIESDSVTLLQQLHEHRPMWLGTDVTAEDALKVRNLVHHRSVRDFPPHIRERMQPFMGTLVELYQPTILGESIRDIAEHIRAKTFVVIGSFRKWLPHIRRIVQDLERHSRGVYPHITTLDVARRQAIADDPNAMFPMKIERGIYRCEDKEVQYLEHIRKADALYVVLPEGRLGESSGRELVEGYFYGKDIYLMNPITTISTSIGDELRQILFGLHEKVQTLAGGPDALRSTNITPLIAAAIRDAGCSKGKLERIRSENIGVLLKNAEAVNGN